MKHQYFGDVNDYVKYGLLRCFSDVGFRVGVCWMLTDRDQRTDGSKVQYLSCPQDWERHDPELFNHLTQVLGTPDGRHLRHIEGPNHIPHARFFGATVPDSLSERSVWSQEMFAVLSGSDLLFFDPDNGIEVPSKAIGQKGSSKYVFWNELVESWKHAKSLLVFQHFPRIKRSEYIPARVQEMSALLSDSLVIPLQSSNVLFLLAYRAVDAIQISRAVNLVEAKWSRRVWRHSDI